MKTNSLNILMVTVADGYFVQIINEGALSLFFKEMELFNCKKNVRYITNKKRSKCISVAFLCGVITVNVMAQTCRTTKTHQAGRPCSPVQNVLGSRHTVQWWCHTRTLALSPWGHRRMGHIPRTPPLLGRKTTQRNRLLRTKLASH